MHQLSPTQLLQQSQSDSELGQSFLQTKTALEQIYPDIQDELCSKQSTLFSQLKNTFMKLYDDFTPQSYIVVNHVVSLTHNESKGQTEAETSNNTNISFALENGLIFLYQRTYLGESIFINGSKSIKGLEEELILTCQGKDLQQQQQSSNKNGHNNNKAKSQQNSHQTKIKKGLRSIIQLANESLSLKKLNGGIIYIYSNISQDVEDFYQKLLLGVYLCMLKINQISEMTSIEEMKKALSQQLSVKFIEKQFDNSYQSRRILHSNNFGGSEAMRKEEGQFENIDLPVKKKMLFCKLPTESQIKEGNLLNLHHEDSQTHLIEGQICSNQGAQKETAHLCFSAGSHHKLGKVQGNPDRNQNGSQIPLQRCFSGKSASDVQSYSNKSIQELYAAQLSSQHGLTHFTVYNSQYLVCLVPSFGVHETIRKLRAKMTKLWESPSQEQQNPELEKKFGKVENIDQLIFTCACSLGLAVLNPQSQMWFK